MYLVKLTCHMCFRDYKVSSDTPKRRRFCPLCRHVAPHPHPGLERKVKVPRD